MQFRLCLYLYLGFDLECLRVNLFLPSKLNDFCFDQPDRLPKSLEKHDKNLYFLTNKIAESLGGSGYSVERLSVPYVPQVTGKEGNWNCSSRG